MNTYVQLCTSFRPMNTLVTVFKSICVNLLFKHASIYFGDIIFDTSMLVLAQSSN